MGEAFNSSGDLSSLTFLWMVSHKMSEERRR